MTNVAYLALGSNEGDRMYFIQDTLRRLDAFEGLQLIAHSEVEETAPVGKTDQPSFLNCMVAVRTTLTPDELLKVCQALEAAGGRVRSEKWGPRTIDVDIVEMGSVSVDQDDLVIPHPELANRPFWINELAEVKALEAAL
jgi:2-amino-4-hydroxy-6-hydroxymethyldihydropteridine diphosphokinase